MTQTKRKQTLQKKWVFLAWWHAIQLFCINFSLNHIITLLLLGFFLSIRLFDPVDYCILLGYLFSNFKFNILICPSWPSNIHPLEWLQNPVFLFWNVSYFSLCFNSQSKKNLHGHALQNKKYLNGNVKKLFEDFREFPNGFSPSYMHIPVGSVFSF